MFQLELKTKITSGLDSFQSLNTIQNKKVWIVCDPFLADSPSLQEVQKNLTSNEVRVFTDVVPDPPIEKVAIGVTSITEFMPNIVIAVGGGSAIDQAKGIVFIFRKLHKNNCIEKFIAIPTTSGTGSEVTNFCVLTDNVENRKYPIVHPSLAPDEAILNANLVLTCPKSVTAFSGLDALGHALEALVTKRASVITDALAEKAISLIFDNLKTCVDKGNDIEARSYMHEASCIAGVAFNESGLGICHALAHQVGGVFHLPHGLTIAIFLPYVIEFNAKQEKARAKYAQIARKTGLASHNLSDAMAVQRLIKKIQQLTKETNCPTTLNKAGIKTADAMKELEKITQNATSDMTFAGNPVNASLKDLENIYLKTL